MTSAVSCQPVVLRGIAAPIGVLALAACAGSGASSSPAHDDPRPVRVAAVTDTMLAPVVRAAGTLGSRDEITLSFKVGGIAARVAVDEGDRVTAGQVLATLEMREVDAGLAKARAAVEKAARELARLERLAAESVATAVQVQDAGTAVTIARADLDAAAFNRARAVIAAPAAGVILRRHARSGELVEAGAPVLTLGSYARGTVFRIGLPDRDLVRIHPGDSARVRLDAWPGREFRGVVRQVGAAPIPSTGAYPVEIAVEGADSLARGLIGKAEISGSRARPIRLVPIEAVLEADEAEATVFVTVPGPGGTVRAERRRVAIAFVTGNTAGIAGGLEGVTGVITDGAAWLEDGEPVRVVP